MIPKHIERLIVKIAEKQGEEEKRIAKENPEACLASLLSTIASELEKRPWSTLDSAVEDSFFDESIVEASKLIRRSHQRANSTRRNAKSLAVVR